MPRPRRTVLSAQQVARLRPALDALVAQTATAERLAGDPLAFPRRYADPADQEVAAFFAAGLAFGRVAAFWPVLEALLERAERHGGPAAWVQGFDRDRAAELHGLQYRWLRGLDFALLAATLGRALERHGRLGAIFEEAWRPSDQDLRPTLARGVEILRTHAESAAPRFALPESFAELPRGFRYLLPSPASGSACKRLCMLARWMVRPPGPPDRVHGLDLGLWQLPTSHLVMPLDTHVHRLALLLGLTRRADASWRTASELTANLRRLHPDDPLRYDFALAHLGISGRCTVRRDGDRPPPPQVCTTCALLPLCGPGRAQAATKATPTG